MRFRTSSLRRGAIAAAIASCAGLGPTPASAQETELASLTDGFDEFQTRSCDVSGDGSLVVYHAVSRTGDRVEVRDLVHGTTTVVSPFWGEPLPIDPVISSDGAFVAFYSVEQLLLDDTNFHGDIYVVGSGGTGLELASVPDGPFTGVNADGGSSRPRLSSDGDRVAFQSRATNLTRDSLGAIENVFVRTRSMSTTQFVNCDAAGVPSNQSALDPFISGNGDYVAFYSAADNLVPGDTNFNHDIFVKNIHTGEIALVSRNSAQEIGAGSSLYPSISHDGRYVAFASNAQNLSGTSGYVRIYRHDRDPDGNGIFDEANGVTELVSRDLFGNDPQQHCFSPRISDDGQRVLFFGSADTDQLLQQNRSVFNVAGVEVYLFDLATQTTANVHVDSHGVHGDSGCYTPGWQGYLALSADGQTAVYGSYADNLDANHPDGRTLSDVFAHHIAKNRTEYLGYDKRGSIGFFPEFTLVGGTGAGETAEGRLHRAPASALAFGFVSDGSNPTPFGGGTIVPRFPLSLPLVVVPTDPAGSIVTSFTSPGTGGAPLDVFIQWVIVDHGFARKPWAISNALKVTIDP